MQAVREGGDVQVSVVEAVAMSRHVNGVPLLDRVSFAVDAGQRVGLVGRSGSGKSLLLRSIAMLEPIDSGERRWRGESISAVNATRFRADVIYVHQRPANFEGTVEDVLRVPFGLAVHRHRQFCRQWIVDRLSTVGRPPEFLRQRHERLSGGEMQLVALLRALQLSPTVLLLDEPTSALDSETASTLETVVEQWHGESPPNRGWVWVSHDLDQVSRLCDQVWRINQGRIEGTVV